jgi:tetratricopeptide (TPR) repeat protein
MKRIVIAIALLAAASSASAQEPPKEMVAAIGKTYAGFDTTMQQSVMTPLSKRFELIADKYPDQWLAQYYAGFSKVMLSYLEPDASKKDMLVDEAEKYLERVRALNIENDERYILEAYVANGRLAVDGEKRWMKYGPIFEKNLDKAKKLNENNVHYYYLKGTSLYYTPKMFGGGAEAALPYFEKSKELFDKMDKTDVTVPYWGHVGAEYFLNEIRSAEKK